MVEITAKYETCKHEDAFYFNQTKDDYEGRVWDLVYCPNCKSFWEERSRSDKHRYPKGSFKIKGGVLNMNNYERIKSLTLEEMAIEIKLIANWGEKEKKKANQSEQFYTDYLKSVAQDK